MVPVPTAAPTAIDSATSDFAESDASLDSNHYAGTNPHWPLLYR